MSRSIIRLLTQLQASHREVSRSITCRTFSTRRNPRGEESFGKDGPTKYLLLLIPAATFGLGTWQVYRREWKLGLIKHLEERTSAPPVPLPEYLEDLQDMEYRKVILKGKFLHDKELYIGPRSLISDGSGASSDSGPKASGILSSGLMSSSQSGYFVITPFKLADSNLTVLVNRGWVPRNKVDPATRPEGQISDEIKLVGVYRNTEKRPQFVPKNQPGKTVFHFREVESMARMTEAAPLFFDADYDSTVQGGPIGGQTIVNVRNEHVSYIVTWYSLTVATLFLWHRRFIKMIPLM